MSGPNVTAANVSRADVFGHSAGNDHQDLPARKSATSKRLLD
jgi:hypothetical protein